MLERARLNPKKNGCPMCIRTKAKYFPAFENDLTNYSKTEFAENFGYEVTESKTDNSVNLETRNYYQPSHEESYDNGL